jgi:tight adherence protein C
VTLILVLGALSVVGALGVLWWAITARPNAAGNLFVGLDLPAPENGFGKLMTNVGTVTHKVVPAPLTRGLEAKLVQAGYPAGVDLPRLMGIKIVAAFVGFMLPLFLGQFLFAFVFGAFGFLAPDLWLGRRRDARQHAMQQAAADMIDQLTICVEAGLGFDAALARVANTNEGPLALELQHTVSDMQAGVPREQALKVLATRTDIAEVGRLVQALVQAQKHGIPLADTLRVQAADTRTKRRQRIEEKAAKLPLKVLAPTMLCIMPALFIVILGPALINITQGFAGIG